MTDHDTLTARIEAMARAARATLPQLAAASADAKAEALRAAAGELRARSAAILAANAEDVARAESNGLSDAMIDRLRLDDDRLDGIAGAVENVAALPDPVGQVIDRAERPNGLLLERVRVPLGVIGIIYESRPNVTADAAALCLRAGNAVILRGGSEAFASNAAIHAAMAAGVAAATAGGASPEPASAAASSAGSSPTGSRLGSPLGSKGVIESPSASWVFGPTRRASSSSPRTTRSPSS